MLLDINMIKWSLSIKYNINVGEAPFMTFNKADYVMGQYFKVAHSGNFLITVLSIISPTKCTILCINIKGVSPTCFGTSTIYIYVYIYMYNIFI